ncbi:DUF4150 domain-containing protein [uncultured Shewanella sp.]|uniref:DUF4150 domain-containing protein n=1 Tax=uncultured Shewanella sp. TaxID=173975 RepID=UPI00262095CA|nr:DUF4150 domain-containing protein [uncultured Shewanella sp.]
MMFANTTLGGMNLGFPDVCNTVVGPAVSPMPYPNISEGTMCNPATAAINVLIDGAPTINQSSMVMLSNGDNAGAVGGVASGMMMGPTTFMVGSVGVIVGGVPCQRLTSTTGQNGMSPNTVGSTLAPSQVKVLVLK